MRLKKLTGALTLFSACGLVALSMGGCVDNRTTLFIHHVYYFEPGDCEISATLDDLQQASGTWNPDSGVPYIAGLIIANGLQPLGDDDTLRPETSRIQIEGAEVEINTANGGAALPAFTVPFSATIDPDEGEEPGLVAAYPVPLIPADAGLADGLYSMTLRVFGTTLSGKNVESGDFFFPVQVSAGSGIFCGTSDEAGDAVHPCGLPQDGKVVVCDPAEGCDCSAL